MTRTARADTNGWTIDGRTARIAFASLADALAYAEGPATVARRGSRATGGDDTWRGSASWDAAVALARDGWAEGRERVARFAARFTDRIMSRTARIAWEYAETGPVFDLGAFLDDDPFCMMRPTEERDAAAGRGPIVRIVANIAVSSGISTETIARRGAAVAALVDALETAGRRCEVAVALGATGGGYKVEIEIAVKAADQPVNMDVLAFALAHGSMLRRIVFGIMEREPATWARATSAGTSYGTPAAHPATATADVSIPEAGSWDSAWTSDERAERYVLDVLRKHGAGIEVREEVPA